MHIDLTDEQKALKAEVRATMERIMTPELRAELKVREAGGPLYHQAMQELGRLGWLGFGWPVEQGGLGRTPVEEFLFFDEVHRSGFPIPLLTLCTVGPTLAKYGTPDQKARLVPEILAGRLHFSIGYTEPSAGTDLASLRTTARRDGDHYVVDGQKVFISLASHADYLWTAVRTGDQPRHKGISVLMIPMDAPGVSRTPIPNLGDADIHAVYLDGVRVPVANRVGAENEGWKLITSQLNHERVALMMVGPLRRLADEVREHAVAIGTIDDPWVQATLARVDAELEVLKLWCWRQAWNLGRGRLRMEEASGLKVYGSELYVRAHRALIEVVGAGALVKGHDLERHYRATLVLTFGGGTNEVQRDIVAMAGLGLPRAER